MQNKKDANKKNPSQEQYGIDPDSKAKQQQTDPQITELKGFVDPSEDLEPTLEDGTKAPDKAPPPNVNE
ncbi:MAG: hypothetical protein ABR502_11475 [Chitinophagaceae bacterium]